MASGIAAGIATSAVDKAKDVSSGLLGQAGSLRGQTPEVMTQAAGLADDLLATGKENGELLLGTIRAEAEKAVVRFGMRRSDDVRQLQERVLVLETEVALLRTTRAASRAASQGSEPTVADEVISVSESGSTVPAVQTAIPGAMTAAVTSPAKKRKIYLEDPDG